MKIIRQNYLLITCSLILLISQQSLSIQMKHLSQSEVIITPERGDYSVIPEKIFASEIHYSRIPHQYWEHRLQMVKSMGFNALSIYIMWNHHEIEKGKFDYTNGDKNLVGFLELAAKYGFKVLFRPGPYVCAQWDFGGLPARLLSIKGMVLRANNKPFLEQVRTYFASLVPIIEKFHYKNGGDIIMLQIENEYGWYGTDKSYIQALRQIWKDLEVTLPEYYVDWIENIQKCHWEGANIGINNGISEDQWISTRKMEPKGYLLGGEIYSGWLTHWGEEWQGKSIHDYVKEFDFLMSNNHSFSMYMAHGGTNFALTAGANGFDDKEFDYGGHITSYDYDAPINEQGASTNKFHAFKELAKKHATWNIPDEPKPIDMIEISPFIPSSFADVLQNLPEVAIKDSAEIVTFEDLRLKMWNQGFVLYETQLPKGTHEFKVTVHDFALVYVNGKLTEMLDRGKTTSHNLTLKGSEDSNTVWLLVESMGHINFGEQILTDFKGLIEFVDLKGELKLLWNHYKIPITNEMLKWTKIDPSKPSPRFYRYNLTLNETGDTYLNMESWKKGYVFVNGYNIGRYWNRGPQQKVFVPGVWLRKGTNDIVVLDLFIESAKFIKGEKTLLLEGDKIFNKVHNPTPPEGYQFA